MRLPKEVSKKREVTSSPVGPQMTRHSLISFHYGRGADPLIGVIGDLRSLGRKTSLRMRVSDPQAAREVINRQIKTSLCQNQASSLD